MLSIVSWWLFFFFFNLIFIYCFFASIVSFPSSPYQLFSHLPGRNRSLSSKAYFFPHLLFWASSFAVEFLAALEDYTSAVSMRTHEKFSFGRVSLAVCSIQQLTLACAESQWSDCSEVSAELYLYWSHEARGQHPTGLCSTGPHSISPWFSRYRRRNSELSYNGYYCLSLLAGMGIRGELLFPTAPVVSVGIKHSLMKSKHQDRFFRRDFSFATWTANAGEPASSFGVLKLKLEWLTENSPRGKTDFNKKNPFIFKITLYANWCVIWVIVSAIPKGNKALCSQGKPEWFCISSSFCILLITLKPMVVISQIL